jgi:hypothetical protein
MDQQAQAYESQQQQAQRQIEAQQRQIEALQRQQTQHHPQAQQHDDLTEKLKKYADLKQQGILTEEEFLKLKADLLSKL